MGKVLFVGDVIIYNDRKITLTDEIDTIFQQHKYRCCNLEGPICSSDKPIKKLGPNIKQNIAADNILKQMGFNVFCLANNHIADYGLSGLLDTKEKLQGEYVLGAGQTEEEAYKPLILDVDGISLGIINAAESGFGCIEAYPHGYAWINSPHIQKTIIDLKKICKYVVCVVHAGLEEFEQPLPEWRDKYREFIDMGADMVIGHHPHVLQGYEEYRGKMIFYSLGNFIWQKSDEYSSDTIMLSIDVDEKELTYQIYAVNTGRNTIKLIERDTTDKQLASYNKVLANDKAYLEAVNKRCVQQFENHYYSLYGHAVGADMGNSLIVKIKLIIRVLLMGLKPRYSVLFHNLEIETHYYSCRRAFRVKQRKDVDQNENS